MKNVEERDKETHHSAGRRGRRSSQEHDDPNSERDGQWNDDLSPDTPHVDYGSATIGTINNNTEYGTGVDDFSFEISGVAEEARREASVHSNSSFALEGIAGQDLGDSAGELGGGV